MRRCQAMAIFGRNPKKKQDSESITLQFPLHTALRRASDSRLPAEDNHLSPTASQHPSSSDLAAFSAGKPDADRRWFDRQHCRNARPAKSLPKTRRPRLLSASAIRRRH